MSRGALVTAKARNALKEINQDGEKLAFARDYVAQAYMGHWGGAATVEKVRSRVHWIAAEARGTRVLDIGTSEGIVPILLGREGFHVVGIDISAEAIDYANQLLEQEPEAVRERISFRPISLFQQEETPQFDTVIMGEVIEHVSNVESFVCRALQTLAPGGRLILTTPFGVHPDRDHKHTFFISDMQALFASRGRIESLTVVDGYIRLLFRNEEPAAAQEQLPALALPDVLALTEEATFASQSLLWRQIDQAGQRIEALQAQMEAAQQQAAQSDAARREQETALQEAGRELADLQERLRSADAAVEARKGELAEQREALEARDAEARRAREEAAEWQARCDALQQELRHLETDLVRAREQQKASQETLAARDTAVQSLEATQTQRESELAAAREQAAAAAERLAERERELAEHVAKLTAQQEALTAAQARCEELSAKVAELSDALASARAEAAALQEREAAFKERLAEGDARATALQQSLDQVQQQRESEREALRAAERQRRSVLEEWEEAQAETRAAQERLAEAERRLAERTQQLAEQEEILTEWAEECEHLDAQRREAEARAAELEQRLAERAGHLTLTQELLADMDAGHARLLARLQEQQGLAAQRAQELDGLRKLLSDLEAKAKSQAEALARAQAAERAAAERLAERERALSAAEARLAEQTKALDGRARELESAQAARKRLESEAGGLRTRLEATTRQQRETARELASLKTQAAQQLTVLEGGERLRWVEPLLELFRRLELEPRKLANLGTELAKERYRDDPFTMLLLASLADALDPQPARRKWLGFRLLKAELPDAAEQVLAPLQGTLAFSPSEQKAWDELVARPKPPALNKPLAGLKVAGILDDFSYQSYAPECRFLQLTPEAWQQELEGFEPDLLFIESAWRGKEEKWHRKVGHNSDELQGILDWCRHRGVPTAFWNKEDPVHFNSFLNTALHFDCVFTTDIDCIGRYKRALGHERVYLLPFACQPSAHNPIETYDRKDAFAFAGAYYVRYPERTRDLESFVAELPKFRPLEIYDRNHGLDHPDYQFPESYRPYIVGTLSFDRIDKAYKGYRYAINLNSIKQSQSMFARRVFELLGSNTLTVSNFSRGLRLLFGDLVISSDNGSEVLRRVQEVEADPSRAARLRLAGLRKILQEHTYRHRLSYVATRVGVLTAPEKIAEVLVVGYARSVAEAEALERHIARQTYSNLRSVIVARENIASARASGRDRRIEYISPEKEAKLPLQRLAGSTLFLASFMAEDYYGPNYITDLVLASHYTDANVIGKGCFYQRGAGKITLEEARGTYRNVERIAARRALLSCSTLPRESLIEWLAALPSRYLDQGKVFSIDAFNYCQEGASGGVAAEGVEETIGDLLDIDTGQPFHTLVQQAEAIPAAPPPTDDAPVLTGAALLASMVPPQSGHITWKEVDQEACHVRSTLADGTHDYIYQTSDHRPETIMPSGALKLYLDASPGLNVRWVVLFLNENRQRLGHRIIAANANEELPLPAGTTWLRFGMRVYGAGEAIIRNLVLGERRPAPVEIPGTSSHLLVTNHYPTYTDLYRNGFVHRRLIAYKARNLSIDVFRVRKETDTYFHEFENVDCTTGSLEQLDHSLSRGRYKSIAVHFLEPELWDILRRYSNRTRILVWVHGAEIQPWWRRPFNYTDDDSKSRAIVETEKKLAFWKNLFQNTPDSVHFVFVSHSFASEAMQDVGVALPPNRYSVINNPIDTDLFAYRPLNPERRKRILSIRPYTSNVYANDLTVAAILALKSSSVFDDLHFRLVGDGPLYDQITQPVRNLPNVELDRRFLTQREIAELHQDYGIFLCPSRMDTQGVSRDEAMSSGLVPVTTRAGAIPEFVDEDCGILVDQEDYNGLADAILALYNDHHRFADYSHAAAVRVREQRSLDIVIQSEIALLRGAKTPC